MYVHTYDIFSGSVDYHPLWLETVSGLESARGRMKERAEDAPGRYFVYDLFSKTVLDVTDTTKEANRSCL